MDGFLSVCDAVVSATIFVGKGNNTDVLFGFVGIVNTTFWYKQKLGWEL